MIRIKTCSPATNLFLPNSGLLNPRTARQPEDLFGRGRLRPDLVQFIRNRTRGFPLDQVPRQPGRDLGFLCPTSKKPSRSLTTTSRLGRRVGSLFASLSRSGLPVEARPGSKLAGAFANGDFSHIDPNELHALLLALALLGQNRNNVTSQAGALVAPRGSWPTNTNHTGDNASISGPEASVSAPDGSAPAATGDFGQAIGDSAEQVANSQGTTGWCFKGVADALEPLGVSLSGASAYMAADQLAQMPDRFQEVSVSPSELSNLPRGAVVVWGQTESSPHGHISIALGDGREASDHIQQQITSLRGASNYRVFVPRS